MFCQLLSICEVWEVLQRFLHICQTWTYLYISSVVMPFEYGWIFCSNLRKKNQSFVTLLIALMTQQGKSHFQQIINTIFLIPQKNEAFRSQLLNCWWDIDMICRVCWPSAELQSISKILDRSTKCTRSITGKLPSQPNLLRDSINWEKKRILKPTWIVFVLSSKLIFRSFIWLTTLLRFSFSVANSFCVSSDNLCATIPNCSLNALISLCRASNIMAFSLNTESSGNSFKSRIPSDGPSTVVSRVGDPLRLSPVSTCPLVGLPRALVVSTLFTSSIMVTSLGPWTTWPVEDEERFEVAEPEGCSWECGGDQLLELEAAAATAAFFSLMASSMERSWKLVSLETAPTSLSLRPPHGALISSWKTTNIVAKIVLKPRNTIWLWQQKNLIQSLRRMFVFCWMREENVVERPQCNNNEVS